MTRIEDFDEDAYYRAHPELKPTKCPVNSRHGALKVEPKMPSENKYHAQRKHPEKELEQFVHDTAKACGLLYYHTYRSRFSEPGFPDCIIIGKWMVVAELKATGKDPTLTQQMWIEAFHKVGIITAIWRPEDKDEIVKMLQNMRVV